MAGSVRSRVGKGGTVVIPASLRQRYGLEEGSSIITEDRGDGILIRSAVNSSEIYTPTRRAVFLLSNATDARDYARAVKLVRKLGLDPAKIRHRKPPGA